MAMHKKSFNVDVDEELSDGFSAQVDKRGYTKYRAIEGALRAFMSLPPEEQVKWMVGADDIPLKSSPTGIETTRDMLRKLADDEREVPGTIIKILSQEGSALAADFRKALGPEPSKQKRKRG